MGIKNTRPCRCSPSHEGEGDWHVILVQSERFSRRGICKVNFYPVKEEQVDTNVLRILRKYGQSLNYLRLQLMRGWGKVKDGEDGNLVILPLLAVSSFARGVTLSALCADRLGCQSPCPILVSPPREAAVCPRQNKRMFAPWSFSLDQAAETIGSQFIQAAGLWQDCFSVLTSLVLQSI